MIVYVLVYDHAHGTDVSVYATEELAQLARADIVAAWCDDLADKGVTKKIRAALKRGHWASAYGLYEDACRGDERITIESAFVEGAEAPDGFSVVEAHSGLVHLVLTWPSGYELGKTRCGQTYHWPGYDRIGHDLVAWVPLPTQVELVTTCLVCSSHAPRVPDPRK